MSWYHNNIVLKIIHILYFIYVPIVFKKTEKILI